MSFCWVGVSDLIAGDSSIALDRIRLGTTHFDCVPYRDRVLGTDASAVGNRSEAPKVGGRGLVAECAGDGYDDDRIGLRISWVVCHLSFSFHFDCAQYKSSLH